MQLQNNAKHFTTYHMEIMNIYFSKVSCENNFKFKNCNFNGLVGIMHISQKNQIINIS